VNFIGRGRLQLHVLRTGLKWRVYELLPILIRTLNIALNVGLGGVFFAWGLTRPCADICNDVLHRCLYDRCAVLYADVSRDRMGVWHAVERFGILTVFYVVLITGLCRERNGGS
jgi:hypothetical protein